MLVLSLPVTREQTGLDRVFLSHFLLFGNEISFNGKCVDNLQMFDTNTNVICCVVNTYGACPDMRWFPPNVGALKFNVDAAVRGNHGPGIIGGIRQDHEGRTLLIFSRSAGLVGLVLVEVIAIKQTICDFAEDVDLVQMLNFDAYRFSISWSRIFPREINWEEVDYYNRLIGYLLENGITPHANLYHCDLPLALQEKYLGLLDRQVIQDFTDYAEFCFKIFGDRVKTWMTFNEPRV
ncbi:hypothetical protein Gohar_019796, partial [Gossypium harknessii]|nr:hypothetical protein [Gossypium harknessii]